MASLYDEDGIGNLIDRPALARAYRAELREQRRRHREALAAARAREAALTPAEREARRRVWLERVDPWRGREGRGA